MEKNVHSHGKKLLRYMYYAIVAILGGVGGLAILLVYKVGVVLTALVRSMPAETYDQSWPPSIDMRAWGSIAPHEWQDYVAPLVFFVLFALSIVAIVMYGKICERTGYAKGRASLEPPADDSPTEEFDLSALACTVYDYPLHFEPPIAHSVL